MKPLLAFKLVTRLDSPTNSPDLVQKQNRKIVWTELRIREISRKRGKKTGARMSNELVVPIKIPSSLLARDLLTWSAKATKKRERENLDLSFTFRERKLVGNETKEQPRCWLSNNYRYYYIGHVPISGNNSPRLAMYARLVMGSSSICAHESWWNSIRKFTLWDSVTTSVWDNVQLYVFTEYSGYMSYFWTRAGICRIRSNT